MFKTAISAYSRSLYADEAGAQLVEYALLAALVAVAAVTALTLIGSNVAAIFSKVGSDV